MSVSVVRFSEVKASFQYSSGFRLGAVHAFAADTQLHQQCLDSFGRCVTSNRLKLNEGKAEVLMIASHTRRVIVSQDEQLRVGNNISFIRHAESTSITSALMSLS